MFPDEDIASPHSNTAVDPSLEYSTDKVVVFWYPPFYFSPWSPSSFVVDDMSYSCAEQYMMAEKANFFSKTIEQWSSSCRRLNQHTRKRIGRGVRNFDSAVGDREKQNAVLSGTCNKFTQNPAMKNHILISDSKLLAEASPLDPVWGTGLRMDDPRANNPCQWRGTILSVQHFLPFVKLFATVRPGRRTRPALVGSTPALRMQEPRNLVRAAAGSLTAASAPKDSPSEFSTYFSDALAD